MFTFKAAKEEKKLAPPHIINAEGKTVIAVRVDDALPDLSTQSYAFTQKALYRKKREVKKILEQADMLIENESK